MAISHPTLSALKKHVAAVILIEFYDGDWEKPARYDFDWFDTEKGVADFRSDLATWIKDDLEYDDCRFVVISTLDTIPEDKKAVPTISSVTAYGGDAAWRKSQRDAFKAEPKLMLYRKTEPVPEGPVGKKAQQAAQQAKANREAAAAKKATAAKAKSVKKAPVKKVTPKATSKKTPPKKRTTTTGAVKKVATRKKVAA